MINEITHFFTNFTKFTITNLKFDFSTIPICEQLCCNKVVNYNRIQIYKLSRVNKWEMYKFGSERKKWVLIKNLVISEKNKNNCNKEKVDLVASWTWADMITSHFLVWYYTKHICHINIFRINIQPQSTHEWSRYGAIMGSPFTITNVTCRWIHCNTSIISVVILKEIVIQFRVWIIPIQYLVHLYQTLRNQSLNCPLFPNDSLISPRNNPTKPLAHCDLVNLCDCKLITEIIQTSNKFIFVHAMYCGQGGTFCEIFTWVNSRT